MFTHIRFITLLLFLFALKTESVSQNRSFQTETPWSWYLEPVPVKIGNCLSNDTAVLMMRVQESEDIQVAVLSFDKLSDIYELRAVAFDSTGQRFPFTSAGGASSGGVYLRNYRLASGEGIIHRLKHVGIEQITEQDHYSIVVPRAAATLQKAGVEILPAPEMGKSYEFEVTTMDGKKLSSSSLRGKVVLMDFWATWCQPCMRMLPELKQLYTRLKDQGLEVVGVNLDHTVDVARGAVQKEELAWPMIMAPTNDQHRDLWETAAGIQSIPRLLIIDRTGILRSDTNPSQFDKEVQRILSE